MRPIERFKYQFVLFIIQIKVNSFNTGYGLQADNNFLEGI